MKPIDLSDFIEQYGQPESLSPGDGVLLAVEPPLGDEPAMLGRISEVRKPTPPDTP